MTELFFTLCGMVLICAAGCAVCIAEAVAAKIHAAQRAKAVRRRIARSRTTARARMNAARPASTTHGVDTTPGASPAMPHTAPSTAARAGEAPSCAKGGDKPPCHMETTATTAS